MALIPKNNIDPVIVASWFISIFGQIQLEEVSNNENGVRKIEKMSIAKLLIPNFRDIPLEKKSLIIKLFTSKAFHPMKFSSLEITDLDKVWAAYLFGDESEKVLSEIFDLYTNYIDSREP